VCPLSPVNFNLMESSLNNLSKSEGRHTVSFFSNIFLAFADLPTNIEIFSFVDLFNGISKIQ